MTSSTADRAFHSLMAIRKRLALQAMGARASALAPSDRELLRRREEKLVRRG